MNEQPSEVLSQLMAYCFMAMFFYFMITNKNKPSRNDSLFKIAYIEEPIYPAPTIIINNETSPSTKHKEDKKKQQFFIDCVNALVSLGFKKTIAQKLTQKIIESHQPTSIQQFLHLAINHK